MVNTALNVSDYISRPELKAYVKQVVNEENHRVHNIVIPDGCKLKRTPEDRLADMGMMNSANLISEFNLILERKSTLPTSLRNTVTKYVVQGMYRLYQSDLQKALQEKESQKALENGNEEESRG